MTQVHATISPGAQLDIPWRADYNGLLYVLNGDGSVGSRGETDRHGPAGGLRPR